MATSPSDAAPATQQLSLFILAGEASGDRIGADLVARLTQRLSVTLSGVGGDELTGQGLRPLFPMSDLAVMGITDVLLRLPKLLWRLEQAASYILNSGPDLVVLIDSQDFSALLARRLRQRGYRGPLVLYVAPSVWARHPERAARLKPLFDKVLAVLPFEPEVMQKLGGPPTVYVGHPALTERLPSPGPVASGPLLLLPGSRQGELRRHIPVLRETAIALAKSPRVEEIVIPTLRSLGDQMRQLTRSWPMPVRVIDNRSERAQAYGSAIGAIAVSGTITLELALANVPMVVVYALDTHQARAFKRLGQPHISLPNIVLGQDIVPELVASPLRAHDVATAALSLIETVEDRRRQIDAFADLSRTMEAGIEPFGRQDPADEILALLQAR